MILLLELVLVRYPEVVFDFADLLLCCTGGLIVLSLFLRQWGVSQCIQVFDNLSRQFFRNREGKRTGIIHYLRRLLKCWLLDGYYDASALEDALKLNFGIHQRMFDSLQPSFGTKVAVTATKISDATPFVFSNYNGLGIRNPNCGE